MRNCCRVNLIMRLSNLLPSHWQPMYCKVVWSIFIPCCIILWWFVMVHVTTDRDFLLALMEWERTENMSEILNNDPTNSMRTFHSPFQRYSKRGFFIITNEFSISCEMNDCAGWKDCLGDFRSGNKTQLSYIIKEFRWYLREIRSAAAACTNPPVAVFYKFQNLGWTI